MNYLSDVPDQATESHSLNNPYTLTRIPKESSLLEAATTRILFACTHLDRS